MTNAGTTDMVPVTIAGVAVASPAGVPGPRERFSIVLASAADGDTRRLFIGVGDAEAAALAFSLALAGVALRGGCASRGCASRGFALRTSCCYSVFRL
jgi:hypothetical protein